MMKNYLNAVQRQPPVKPTHTLRAIQLRARTVLASDRAVFLTPFAIKTTRALRIKQRSSRYVVLESVVPKPLG